jgi:hypothetical protein
MATYRIKYHVYKQLGLLKRVTRAINEVTGVTYIKLEVKRLEPLRSANYPQAFEMFQKQKALLRELVAQKEGYFIRLTNEEIILNLATNPALSIYNAAFLALYNSGLYKHISGQSFVDDTLENVMIDPDTGNVVPVDIIAIYLKETEND